MLTSSGGILILEQSKGNGMDRQTAPERVIESHSGDMGTAAKSLRSDSFNLCSIFLFYFQIVLGVLETALSS